VTDYVADVRNTQSGVFDKGRYHAAQDRFDRAPGFGRGADAGALFANWQFNHAQAVLLEDSYVNNNGVLYGRPGFADESDGLRKSVVFNGRNQYAEAPPSVADFGELTIDIMVNRSGGKGGRLFDFGTSDEECFYLSLDGGGKPTLTARHKGKIHTVAAAQGIPVNKWARVRVEMDGRTASIYLDGKQVARKGFAFSPRTVFIGDEPEGNFIACGRNKNEFFAGKMDHFRIYRKVHANFDAVGPPPSALVQMSEWSEKEQQRHDQWQKLRKATEDELRAGKYGQLQAEIRKLQQQKVPEARIEALRKQAQTVRDNALKSAGVLGRNPYLGGNAAKLHEFQRSLKYHTTADWDYRIQGEKEGKIPPKAKKWLLRVRGY